jgi:hypothetical protein
MENYNELFRRVKNRVQLNEEMWKSLEQDLLESAPKRYVMGCYNLSSTDYKVLREFYYQKYKTEDEIIPQFYSDGNDIAIQATGRIE